VFSGASERASGIGVDCEWAEIDRFADAGPPVRPRSVL